MRPLLSTALLRLVFSDDQYAIAQREALARIATNCSVERGVPDGDTRGRRDYPSNVVMIAVPHFDAEWQVGGDVMEVRICQFAQQCVDAKGFRRSTPQAFALGAQLL